jgi:hypothetical protein
MTHDPFTIPHCLHAFRHAAQTFLQRGRFAVNFLQAEGIILQMNMCVGETRQNDASAEIELLGAGIEQFVAANRDDFTAVNEQSGGCLLRGVEGVDVGVVEKFHVERQKLLVAESELSTCNLQLITVFPTAYPTLHPNNNRSSPRRLFCRA